MPLSSSPTSCSAALALLLALVTLTGVLPLAASSRGHGVASTTDAAPLEEHGDLLMMERFHAWMAKHGQSYATPEEKLRRFEIYRQNVRFIEAANRDGRLSYTLGENKFTDLTHEEFLDRYTSRRRAPPPPRPDPTEEDMVITTRAGNVSEGSFLPAADDKVPHRVNWTAKGKVTPIKSQGSECGACWAFTAVEAIESAYAIAKGVDPPVLSVQELIDCDVYDSGCNGGWVQNAFKWVKRIGGIALASQYPYMARDEQCQEKKRLPHAVSIRDYGYVKARSEEELMKHVTKQPIAVAFDSTDMCFKSYRHGVYDGMCYTDEGVYVGPCTDNKLVHGLNIVGYVGKGDDPDKYWIARNSWGEDWGQGGYVLLRKDVPSPQGICGIVTTQPSYPCMCDECAAVCKIGSKTSAV